MNVTVSATSKIALPTERARNLIAATAQWQAETGEATAAAALEHIDVAEDQTPNSFPACICYLNEWGIQKQGPTHFEGVGTIRAIFYLEVPALYISEDGGERFVEIGNAYMDHANRVGQIIKQMGELTINASTANGYLSVEDFTYDTHGLLDDTDENGKFAFVSEWLLEFHAR